MIRLTILLLVLIAGFVLEFFLSRNKNWGWGVIIPAVSFLLSSVFILFNVSKAFASVTGYGSFLLQYGRTGLIALILKVGFIYLPVVIQLIIFALCRRHYKKTHAAPGDATRGSKR
ncbi:MAG: hypothetical protein R2912_03100 [Eubacteriales bacterium]